ncbi:MAG: hypothetical protein ACK4S0_01050 [Sediminibacterium sp.]
MKRAWNKINDTSYTFIMEEKVVGKLEIFPNTLECKGNFSIDDQVFEIKRTGFWKSQLTITNDLNEVVLKLYPEKWYANTSIIELEDRQLKLKIRNNPLAEFVISEHEQELLAYGLDTTNHKISVRITDNGNKHVLLDFLLWYLFAPVINEHSADTYSFLFS